MCTHRIALYPGDGIGIEVTAETRKVLTAVAEQFGLRLEITEYPWSCAYAVANGDGKPVPDDFLDTLAGYDAVFLGAVGDPQLLPDHVSLVPLIRMRQEFDQYVCLRPVRLLPGVRTPLAGKTPADIDLMVVRENSEGEYAALGGPFRTETPEEIAIETAVHTRRGIERILRYGFELARKRSSRLTMATKSNALKYGMVLWDRVLAGLVGEYPDVAVQKYHVDALAMHFVNRPEAFDVVVASNLFGDILSDLGGAISGSLGLAPSANINPERRYPSLFEPVHGSAPDIAGRGVANPLGAIRSAALMLDFLGEMEAAQGLETAVAAQLSAGRVRTPDLGGSSTCTEVGDDIVGRITR